MVMCARGSHLSPFSVPPYHRVLVLFNAFGGLDCWSSLCDLIFIVKTYFFLLAQPPYLTRLGAGSNPAGP